MRIGLRCVTKFENKYYRAEVTKNLPSVTEVSDDYVIASRSVKEPLDNVCLHLLMRLLGILQSLNCKYL